eukprot:g44909.t1
MDFESSLQAHLWELQLADEGEALCSQLRESDAALVAMERELQWAQSAWRDMTRDSNEDHSAATDMTPKHGHMGAARELTSSSLEMETELEAWESEYQEMVEEFEQCWRQYVQNFCNLEALRTSAGLFQSERKEQQKKHSRIVQQVQERVAGQILSSMLGDFDMSD